MPLSNTVLALPIRKKTLHKKTSSLLFLDWQRLVAVRMRKMLSYCFLLLIAVQVLSKIYFNPNRNGQLWEGPCCFSMLNALKVKVWKNHKNIYSYFWMDPIFLCRNLVCIYDFNVVKKFQKKQGWNLPHCLSVQD